MCGADDGVQAILTTDKGSSPRVRSRLLGSLIEHLVIGIISACAEQTIRHLRRVVVHGDHLRVCGADRSLRH